MDKQSKNKENIRRVDLNKELRNTGIILIILGILHVVLSGFLSLAWGLILIPLGIISLFYHSKKMLLVFGILLILLGLWNFILSVDIAESMGGGSSVGPWMILGIFQIYWGIKEINRFRRIKEENGYLVELINKKSKAEQKMIKTAHSNQGYSGFAIAGFVLSFLGILAFLGIIFSLIGLFVTGENKKKGRGLAIAGLIIAIIMFNISLIALLQG